MGGERLRPLTGLARAAGSTAARLLPARRRAPVLAIAGGVNLDDSAAAAQGDQLNAASDRGRDRLVSIRLLAITDFHGALLSAGDQDGRPAGGAAYLAAHLRQERAARPGRTLLLHNGDVVGRTPAISGLLQDEPAVAVLEAIGCDAGVVGDHEFDEGLDELFRLLDGGTHPSTLWHSGNFPGCSFPWLAANAVSEATGHPILPAYRVFDLEGVRVAVVGVVTTETPSRVGGGVLGLRFVDEAATVNRYVRELREGPEGADAVVVLAHLGGTGVGPGQVGGSLARFASAIDGGVDAIFAGDLHRHTYVANVAGTIVVQGPPYGAAYAAVDLEIDPDAGRVVHRSAKLVPVWQDGIAPDPEVAAIVERAGNVSASLAAEPVAEAAAALRRDPPEDAAVPPLGELTAQAFLRATGAEIAAVHDDELRADLPAGPLTRGDLYAALPGGQSLVALRLTGEQLRRLLEAQWTRERTSRLNLAGVLADVATDAPLGQRVRRIRLADGRPLERGRTYAVAMSGFLAGGGDGFGPALAGTDRTSGPQALDALADYLRALPQPIAGDLASSAPAAR
jgi:5'-nucleotidase